MQASAYRDSFCIYYNCVYVYIWVYSCLIYVLCLLLIHFFFIVIDPIIPLKQEVLVFLWLFVKRQTSDRSSNNEWQRVVMNGTSSDNESQRVVQWVTASDNEWQRMTMSGYFGQFFFFREDSTSRHPKGNPLNPEENLEEHILN